MLISKQFTLKHVYTKINTIIPFYFHGNWDLKVMSVVWSCPQHFLFLSLAHSLLNSPSCPSAWTIDQTSPQSLTVGQVKLEQPLMPINKLYHWPHNFQRTQLPILFQHGWLCLLLPPSAKNILKTRKNYWAIYDN